ncbi:Serine/threonine-protein kinase/endoribonuclease IRE1a [Rhynchospora pubera]|uniref:Serine/threonine-protein kinase/endoribonuclease IRE1a n=1 Tax=Rhynchospora pubera TaxID=906938 RepID=A0AAV8DWH4_9POAL|nr:Serine/threonine-protein kinase/endoribonuclease IRE1a [Rhynchospora pubera]
MAMYANAVLLLLLGLSLTGNVNGNGTVIGIGMATNTSGAERERRREALILSLTRNGTAWTGTGTKISFGIGRNFFLSGVERERERPPFTSTSDSDSQTLILRVYPDPDPYPIPIAYEARSLFVVSKIAKACPFLHPPSQHSSSRFDLRLVIHEDGVFQLTNTSSGVPLWKISTYDPLPSQSNIYIPKNPDYYLFPGQRARLYVLTITGSYKRYPLSVDQYVATTPEIRGSTIILGSKLSTEYVIDACSGNLVYKFVPANVTKFAYSTVIDENPWLSNQNTYIMVIRTDYTVMSFNFTRVVWNWSYTLFTAYHLSSYECALKPPIIPIRFQGDGPILAWIANRESPSAKNVNPCDSASVNGTWHKSTNWEKSYIHSRTFWTILCITLAFYCILLRVSIKKKTEALICKLLRAARKESNSNTLVTARKEATADTLVSASQGGSLNKKKKKKKRSQNVKKNGGSGEIVVPACEIGKDNNRAVVLEIILDGRPTEVKRLLRADYALQSPKNTFKDWTASDTHQNIARFYGYSSNPDFIDITIERCSNSLFGMVKNEDKRLWTHDGYPSPELLKVLRDVISGLVHLHDLGIAHGNLKPQNVLVNEGPMKEILIAKLSDIGIIERLKVDSSHATGSDAPEQLLSRSQGKAADVFNLGCLIFFCLSRGGDPYGEPSERDKSIRENKYDLFSIDYMPEALDLLPRLLNNAPFMRPDVKDIVRHPLLWDSDMRVSFLCDTSLRMKKEDRTDIIKDLECLGPAVFGKKWDQSMRSALLANLQLHRQYEFDSMKDLLRAIRNLHAHYLDLPDKVQEILGESFPAGFAQYFAKAYPKLLIETYKFVDLSFRNEEFFKKYFE